MTNTSIFGNDINSMLKNQASSTMSNPYMNVLNSPPSQMPLSGGAQEFQPSGNNHQHHHQTQGNNNYYTQDQTLQKPLDDTMKSITSWEILMMISVAVVFPFFAFQLTTLVAATQDPDASNIMVCDPKLSLLSLGVIAIIIAFVLRNSSYKFAMKGLFAGGIITLLLATLNMNNSSMGDLLCVIFLSFLLVALIWLQPKCQSK